MAVLNNLLDILKLLDKSNCRECGFKSCMAFAAAVLKEEKALAACPRLDREILEQYGGNITTRKSEDTELEETLAALKAQIRSLDLAKAAERLGAPFSGGKLTLECLGKAFSIDAEGRISTELHVNRWLIYPIFSYILSGAGKAFSGNWIPFRELEGGKKWHRLFGQRCEKPLKQVADSYPDLFEDLIRLFEGRQVENHYESDISLVLRPLPRVPILICYWKQGALFESDLNIFFDITAEENLPVDALYTMVAGLVLMFEKISLRHGRI